MGPEETIEGYLMSNGPRKSLLYWILNQESCISSVEEEMS